MEKKKKSPRSSPGILPKSPLVYEKYKSGCAWRLIGLFDFGQSRSGKKLVSDKPKGHRYSYGNGYSRSQLDLLRRLHEKCQCTDTVEEEISCKPKTDQKSAYPCETQHEKSDSKSKGELLNRETIRRSKNVKEETWEKPAHGHEKVAVLGQTQYSLSVIEKSAKMMNKDKQMGVESDPDQSCEGMASDLDQRRGEINIQVCVNAAAEALMSKKPRDGSKSFLDALDVLSANKELFITLLQDPNSLSVKQIQDIRGSQPKNVRDKSSMRGKISEKPMKKPGKSEDLDKIVLLKLRLTSSDEDNFYLRFKRMAKKLKLMVGSNKDDGGGEDTMLHSILSSEGTSGAREAGITQKTSDSPKRMEKSSDEADSQRRNASTSTTELRSSELPVFKRKKRVESEVFRLNTESEVLPRRVVVEKRERINSSPVYDNLNEQSSRFEERNRSLEHENRSYRLHFKSFNTLKPNVLDSPDDDSSTGSEITEETSSSLKTFRNLHTNILFSDGLNPESADSLTCDPKMEQEQEQPSPVSVLERIQIEDDTIMSRNVKSPTAEQIGVSSYDLNDDLRTIFEEATVCELVKNVLGACGLDWTDFLATSGEPSLLDDEELFSHNDHHQRLVLDYRNEILQQMYQRHIKSWPFLKEPRLSSSIFMRSDLVNEAMKRIDWSLVCDSAATPRTLDELGEIDLGKQRDLWMDIGGEIEVCAVDMAEGMLEALEMEIAMELVMMQKRWKRDEFTRLL